MLDKKICTRCELELPIECYTLWKHKNGHMYPNSRCKTCRKAIELARYNNNPVVRKRIRDRATRPDVVRAQQARNRERYRTDANYRQKVLDGTKRKAQINRDYVHEYLKNHPCEDCGETDIVVLEFDHIDKELKTESIARMIRSASLERLKTEMAKCRVLCANDHKRRTAKQFNWTKL